MKQVLIFSIVCLMTVLTSCASKDKTDSGLVVNPNRQDVVMQKEKDLNALESRLNANRDAVYGAKFRNNSDARRLMNNRYADVGTARTQLSDLRNSVDDADFSNKLAALDSTLDSLRLKVDQKAAE